MEQAKDLHVMIKFRAQKLYEERMKSRAQADWLDARNQLGVSASDEDVRALAQNFHDQRKDYRARNDWLDAERTLIESLKSLLSKISRL